MKDFLYKIYENTYQDDYEHGEINGTYSSIFIEEGKVSGIEALAKRVGQFKYDYAQGEDPKIWIDDNFVHTDMMMTADEDGCFYKPSDDEVEAWKKGDATLYNVEYCMHIYMIETLSQDELTTALTEAGVSVAV